MVRLLSYEFLLRWLIVWKKLSLRYTLMTSEYFQCRRNLMWLTKEMEFYRAPLFDTESVVRNEIIINVNICIKHAHVRIPVKNEELPDNSLSNYVIGFFREQRHYFAGCIERKDGTIWKLETYWAHCN